MACKMKTRKDDIPKRAGEKSWSCDACGMLVFAKARPRCRKEVQAEMDARHAAAEAELYNLDKGKP
jgi:DNA-directed RNA polymerase subunit RPC12/RpoP